MFIDNAPSQLIALAVALALVGAGLLITFTALGRRRRNKKARAVRHTRELIQKARLAVRSNSPDQALQVPILVRLVMQIAEREGLQLHETGACRHSLQTLMSEARRTLKEARDKAEREKKRGQIALDATPFTPAAAKVTVTAPTAAIEADPVIMPDGLTYIYTHGGVEIIFVVEPPDDAGRSAEAAAPFEIERFQDTRRSAPARKPVPPARNTLGHEAGNLPEPDQVDELIDRLIIKKDD